MRVEDEPLFAQRVAGIDIAKAGIEVAVRVPSDTTAGRRQQETRFFRTTRKELLALADWLRSWGVTKVGMESTGDYWKPVYFLLEQQDLDCVLYHAAQVKALPGRPKTDKQDAVWIAKITERGQPALQLRAPRRHPPAADPHPLPPHRDPGPHRRDAASGKTARRRAPEAVQRDLRHPRGLRPGRWKPSSPGNATRSGWPSWPAAGCAARSASWRSPGLLLPDWRARLHPDHVLAAIDGHTARISERPPGSSS